MSQSYKDYLTKEFMEDLYINQRLSVQKSAEKAGVGKKTFADYMDKHGIKRRKGRDALGEKYRDLSGEIFGRLLVIKELGLGRGNCMMYLCKCNCGGPEFIRDHKTSRSQLLHAKILSCGCYQTELMQNRHKGVGDIGKEVTRKILVGAASRNIPFNVSIDYLWKLFLQQKKKCAITGVDLNFKISQKKGRETKRTASLDRIDSSKGYVEGNVQWVHNNINVMKWKMSSNEFVDWCYKVIRNYEKQHERNN